MPRIFLSCWGTLGEVLPFAGFARDLTTAGHEVFVAGPENLRVIFDGTATGYCALPPGPREMQVTVDTVRHLFNPTLSWERLLSQVIDPYCEAQFHEVSRFIQKSGVDVAFCSWITPGASLAAEASETPTIRCHLYPQSLFQKSDLPLFSRWCRAMTGSRPKITDRIETRRAIVQHFSRLTPRLNKLAASCGLSPVTSGMFAVDREESHQLALFPAALLRKAEPGCLHLQHAARQKIGELPAQLTRFLASGPAPILVALGSVIPVARPDLLDLVARACQEIGERAILHQGPFNQPIVQHGPNLISISTLPPPWLLPRVKAVVHHGGMGSLRETLGEGLPSVSLPQGFDQLDNAKRLEELALGTWVAPSRQNSETIGRALVRALHQEAETHAAKQWNQSALTERDLTASSVISTLGL